MKSPRRYYDVAVRFFYGSICGLLLAFATVFTLSCGQKGPLKMPDTPKTPNEPHPSQ